MAYLSSEGLEREQGGLQELLFGHVDNGPPSLATAHGDLLAEPSSPSPSPSPRSALVGVVVGSVVGFIEAIQPAVHG